MLAESLITGKVAPIVKISLVQTVGLNLALGLVTSLERLSVVDMLVVGCGLGAQGLCDPIKSHCLEWKWRKRLFTYRKVVQT